MTGSDVSILYRRELRSALRERSVVVNGVLLPVVLYPFILWVVFTGFSFVAGLREGLISRVAVLEDGPRQAELLDSLGATDDVELRVVGEAEEALTMLRAGDLDALVELLPPDSGARALEGNFRARLSYDRSEARSREARERVEALLDRHRGRRLEREAAGLGLDEAELERFAISERNVATEEEMGAFLLGQMVPLFLVVMVALGCLVPAIDSTAGERERSTWETTMTVAASRRDVVVAKYLYVATLGAVAGILNVLAVTFSLGPIVQSTLGSAESGQMAFTIQARAVPIMILGAVLLALFFAAAMMIVASFARTFKDGQAMATPVYYLVFLPLLLGDDPDARLTPGLAAVPIANVAGMIRDAILGSFDPALVLLTCGVGVATVAACLAFAHWTLGFEDHLLGSYDGSVFSFAKDRLFQRTRRSRA